MGEQLKAELRVKIEPNMRPIATLSAALLTVILLACSQKGDPMIAQRAAQPAHVDPSQGAVVNGTIQFEGATPKAQRIDMSMDPGCRDENQNETFVVHDGKLANVLVYVKDGLPGGYTYAAAPVTIDQKGCRYVPHVAAVAVGQEVRITNSDPANHNVHPMPRNNPGWNESQMPTSPVIVKRFDHPELMMPIQCNQHPWMRMYLSVLPNPWFAVSGDNGSFVIRGLPPGDYTIAAVHEKLGERTMKVHLGAKENKSGVDFQFAAQ